MARKEELGHGQEVGKKPYMQSPITFGSGCIEITQTKSNMGDKFFSKLTFKTPDGTTETIFTGGKRIHRKNPLK